MKLKIAIIAVVAVASACLVFAQSADDLKTQIDALDQQIMSLRRAFHQSPDFQTLLNASAATEKAYEDALSATPEISDIDNQIASLKQQLSALISQRAGKEAELDAGALAGVKAAKDQAEQNLHDAQPPAELTQAIQTRNQLQAQQTSGSTN